jgi:ABC-type multidrug transport system fused ATPase/permease subunit
VARDVLLIQEAISEKAGSLLQYTTTFAAGFAIGFVSGWRMALVILAVTPLLAACAAFMGTLLMRLSTKGQAAYAAAGAVAEETLSSIRTVAAFGGEPYEVERYTTRLEQARVENTKKGVTTGLGLGTFLFVMFCSYALAFWYGATLVEAGTMSAGDVVTTFFGMPPCSAHATAIALTRSGRGRSGADGRDVTGPSRAQCRRPVDRRRCCVQDFFRGGSRARH